MGKGRKGQGPGESESSKRRIIAVEQEAKAINLRKSGATYDQIAKQLGYNSPQAAHLAVKRALIRTIQEPADEYRALMLERYGTMLRAIWPNVLKGNLHAVDRAIKINEQMGRITGLDKTPHFNLETGQVNFQQNNIQTNIAVSASPNAGVVDPEQMNKILEIANRFGLMPLMEPRLVQARVQIEAKAKEDAEAEAAGAKAAETTKREGGDGNGLDVDDV